MADGTIGHPVSKQVAQLRYDLYRGDRQATRALNMNAEQVAVFEDFTRVVQCAKRFRPTGTIHGEHANRSEPPLLELAFDALCLRITRLPY